MERLGRTGAKIVASLILIVVTWPYFSEIFMLVQDDLNATGQFMLFASLGAFYYLIIQLIVAFAEGDLD